jgi:hypothetical protein
MLICRQDGHLVGETGRPGDTTLYGGLGGLGEVQHDGLGCGGDLVGQAEAEVAPWRVTRGCSVRLGLCLRLAALRAAHEKRSHAD